MRMFKHLEKATCSTPALQVKGRALHTQKNSPIIKTSARKSTIAERSIFSPESTRELQDGMQLVDRLIQKSAKEILQEHLEIFGREIKETLNRLETKHIESAAQITELRNVTSSDIKELRNVTSSDMKELRNVTSSDMKKLEATLEKDLLATQLSYTTQMSELKESNAQFHASMHKLVSDIYRSQTNRTNAFLGLAVAGAGLYLGLKEYGFFHTSYEGSRNTHNNISESNNIAPKT